MRTLPVPRRPLLPRVAACAALALALASASASATAMTLLVDPPRERSGVVWVDVRLEELFPPRLEQSLSRGMPATLELHAELWRRRQGWFDRLDRTFDASIRIRFEVWNETYRLERTGAAPLSVGTLDSVRAAFARRIALPVARTGELAGGARYYLVVTATLKPLSVEDVAEVEGWLSGEVEDKRRARIGAITELPRSVFDAVRNFSGFGDQKARAISSDFDLHTLSARR